MEPHDYEPSLDYNFIADGIFVGTNQCCLTHFDDLLSREGITVDVSLEEIRLDQPFGVESYLWLPTKDHASPSPDQFAMGVAFLAQAVKLKKKIYVHCKNGHGRAPTLVAAYFISNGKSLGEAIALLKSQRPSIHLQDSQMEGIRNFARTR